MNSNNKIWGTLLKVALGLIFVLSFLQVKMKFGWDPWPKLVSICCGDRNPINPGSDDVNSNDVLLKETRKKQESEIGPTRDSQNVAQVVIKEEVILVNSIILDKEKVSIDEGKSVRVNAMISPKNATNKTLIWKSDSNAVATVDNGVVTGKREGECMITASSTDGSNVVKLIKVRVQKIGKKVTSIEFDKSSLTINIGDRKQIVAKVFPKDATNKTLKWKSDKEGVATVNKGVVTGKSEGNCMITASSTDGSNVHKSIKVQVVKIPEPPVPKTPSLKGNTIQEKIKNGLAYFSDSRNDIENKAIIATQMSKLFDDEAVVIVKRQNFDRVNPNAKDYITTISTSKLNVTYVGHKVNAKGLITELTVKQY